MLKTNKDYKDWRQDHVIVRLADAFACRKNYTNYTNTRLTCLVFWNENHEEPFLKSSALRAPYCSRLESDCMQASTIFQPSALQVPVRTTEPFKKQNTALRAKKPAAHCKKWFFSGVQRNGVLLLGQFKSRRLVGWVLRAVGELAHQQAWETRQRSCIAAWTVPKRVIDGFSSESNCIAMRSHSFNSFNSCSR